MIINSKRNTIGGKSSWKSSIFSLRNRMGWSMMIKIFWKRDLKC